MSRKKRLCLIAIAAILTVLAAVLFCPHHPLDAHVENTIILNCSTAALYSSAPQAYWKLEPGSEAHTQLLELAREYPARIAPWRALADLPLFAPWQQKPGHISADTLWHFFTFDTAALDTFILTLDGSTLRTDSTMAYRVDPAFAEALREFANSLDERYFYTPLGEGNAPL